MTTPDYSISMAGSMVLEWNIGMDEDGKVTGFIGLPPTGAPDDADEVSKRGAVLTWGDPPLTGWTDDDLANAIILACRFALREYIASDLFHDMHTAIMEARERIGGYRAEDDPQAGRITQLDIYDQDEDEPDEG